VDRDDAQRGRGIQRGQLRMPPLFGCQPVAGGRPHEVVRAAGQRLLCGEALRIGKAGCAAAQRGRGGRRVDVHAGEVDGSVAGDAVQIGGARRCSFRPAGFVPPVPPDRTGMGASEVIHHLQAVP
jgi:hypothetical protein